MDEGKEQKIIILSNKQCITYKKTIYNHTEVRIGKYKIA